MDHFEFHTKELGPDHLEVLGFQGVEALSEVPVFDVYLSCRPKMPQGGALQLHQVAKLSIVYRDKPRVFQGIITNLRSLVQDGNRRWQVRLSPAPCVLQWKAGRTVFRKNSVPEIVAQLAKRSRIPVIERLHGTYLKHAQRMQYDENELDFLARLMADEGITFLCAEAWGEPGLMLIDKERGFKPIHGDPSLPFEPIGGIAEKTEHVFDHRSRIATTSNAFHARDFDLTHPAVDLAVTNQNDVVLVRAPFLEYMDYPGGYLDPAQGGRVARNRLAELGLPAVSFTGQSTSPRMCAGHTFRILHSGLPGAADPMLITRVVHHGRTRVHKDAAKPGESKSIGVDYDNCYEAIPAKAPYLPSRSALPTPRMTSPMTAKVVGRVGEDIDTDDLARVMIRYDWEREGDLAVGTWARVRQAWAGREMGALFIPRLGQEVVVKFEAGDLDRPLVIGCLYNKEHCSPIPLPENATLSGIRTQSSPGGHGYNEWLLEDAAGHERMEEKAQRNKRIQVLWDKRQKVGRNVSLKVVRHRGQEVGRDQSLLVTMVDTATVARKQDVSVGLARLSTIGAEELISVGADRQVEVAGDNDQSVANSSITTIGNDHLVEIGGNSTETVGGDVVVQVEKNAKRSCEKEHLLTLKSSRRDTIAGNASWKVHGGEERKILGNLTQVIAKDVKESVGGNETVVLSGKTAEVKDKTGKSAKSGDGEQAAVVVLDAGSASYEADTVTLTVGKSGITISKGTITIYGTTIMVDGDGIKLKGAKVDRVSGSGSGGGQGAGAQITDETGHKLIAVRLVGMHFETSKCFLLPAAMRGIRKVVKVYAEHPKAELLCVGHTDTAGSAEYNRPLSLERAKAIVAYLTDDAATWMKWFGKSAPEAKRWGLREIQYMLTALPDRSKKRYFEGPVTGTDDQPSRDAIKAFQAAEGMKDTGVADDATKQALVKRYMALDHTSLPGGAKIKAHGCGEHFPLVKTTDGVHEPANRRCEVFVSDGPFKPAPNGELSGPGAKDYPAWQAQVIRTINVSDDQGLDADLRQLNLLLKTNSGEYPLGKVKYEIPIQSGWTIQGETDEKGLLFEDEVPPGDYLLKVGENSVWVSTDLRGNPPREQDVPGAYLGGELGQRQLLRLSVLDPDKNPYCGVAYEIRKESKVISSGNISKDGILEDYLPSDIGEFTLAVFLSDEAGHPPLEMPLAITYSPLADSPRDKLQRLVNLGFAPRMPSGPEEASEMKLALANFRSTLPDLVETDDGVLREAVALHDGKPSGPGSGGAPPATGIA